MNDQAKKIAEMLAWKKKNLQYKLLWVRAENNRLDSAPEVSGKTIFIISLNNFLTAYLLKGHCHQKK